MPDKKILLIISCGKKKSEEVKIHPVKAEEAYKGPMFQVINKAKRENRWPQKLQLGIISAKYGFLRGDELIDFYDIKINRSIAEKLRPEILKKISQWHKEITFSLIYALMGQDYLDSIKGLELEVDTQVKIETMGGLGKGQKKLKDFIYSLNSK